MKKITILITILAIMLVLLNACSQMETGDYPSEDELAKMSDAELSEAMQKALEDEPLEELSEEGRMAEEKNAETMEGVEATKTGNFQGRAHPTSGIVEIKEQDGRYVVIFSEDFRVDAGPALYVVGSKNKMPQNSKDLHEGDGFVELAALKSTTGTQTYLLPEGITVEDLGSIAVYCKPFRVVFGFATLE